MKIEKYEQMYPNPVSIEQFAKAYVCDDDCPPGTFKLQKMLQAIDRHAVSGPPMGLLDRTQKSPDKQGYYLYEWQDDNPYEERPIWLGGNLS